MQQQQQRERTRAWPNYREFGVLARTPQLRERVVVVRRAGGTRALLGHGIVPPDSNDTRWVEALVDGLAERQRTGALAFRRASTLMRVREQALMWLAGSPFQGHRGFAVWFRSPIGVHRRQRTIERSGGARAPDALFPVPGDHVTLHSARVRADGSVRATAAAAAAAVSGRHVRAETYTVEWAIRTPSVPSDSQQRNMRTGVLLLTRTADARRVV